MNTGLRPQSAALALFLTVGGALLPGCKAAAERLVDSHPVRGWVKAGLIDHHRAFSAFAPVPQFSTKPGDDLLTLDPGRHVEENVVLLIATKKTNLPRFSDNFRRSPRDRRHRTSRAVFHRVMDDANFVNKTKALAARIMDVTSDVSTRTAAVSNGEQFLEALVTASEKGPIANVVIFGHAAPSALYMAEDRGFYGAVASVAKATPLAKGDEIEKAERLRAMGARDLGDLERLIEHRRIRFAANAVIVFAGCDVAGNRHIDRAGIASRMADITGATVVASVGPTDQSMARGRTAPANKEYSRGIWVRFIKGATPNRLTSRWLDPLKELHLSVDRPVASRPSDNADSAADIPAAQPLRCAFGYSAYVKSASFVPCGQQPGLVLSRVIVVRSRSG